MPSVAGAEGAKISIHACVYDGHLLPYLAPINASLTYGCLFVLACFLVIWVMDLAGLHLRA